MRIHIPGFQIDSRGNRLLRAQTRSLPSRPGRLRLHLRAADGVGRQVGECLRPWNPEPLEIRPEDIEQDWTHRWDCDGPLEPEMVDVIRLLKEVLTLVPPADVDLAIALDFYKDPEEAEDGSVTWHDTEAGRLVWRGKHQYDADIRETAWDEMARRLAAVIKRHPLLRRADAIVSVPGHITTQWRPGERVASRTARLVDLPLVRTTARHEMRPEAKGAEEGGEPVDLSDEFTVPLRGGQRTVIVVDDVVRSGGSMAAVAGAARRSGAQVVYGLACARTRRKR